MSPGQIVRMIGSLLLALLALGGFLTFFRFVGQPDYSGTAAIIDLGIPVLLAFGAWKAWPKRKRPTTTRAPTVEPR